MTHHESVGHDLASRVADQLEDGLVLAHGHRDYCGMGLEVIDGVFVYGRVADGWVRNPHDLKDGEGAVFDTRDAFVDWLAQQTDPSLSGHDLERDFYRFNQRLTLDRLRAFANGGDGRT